MLFTLDRGALPAWATHLYCDCKLFLYFLFRRNNKYIDNFIDCKVNYHRNFQVLDKQHIYNCEIPDILQIGEHQFAETSLINQCHWSLWCYFHGLLHPIVRESTTHCHSPSKHHHYPGLSVNWSHQTKSMMASLFSCFLKTVSYKIQHLLFPIK